MKNIYAIVGSDRERESNVLLKKRREKNGIELTDFNHLINDFISGFVSSLVGP